MLVGERRQARVRVAGGDRRRAEQDALDPVSDLVGRLRPARRVSPGASSPTGRGGGPDTTAASSAARSAWAWGGTAVASS
jgi:hypothetical protein